MDLKKLKKRKEGTGKHNSPRNKPRIKIDLNEVERLRSEGYILPSIADAIGCSLATLNRRIKKQKEADDIELDIIINKNKK